MVEPGPRGVSCCLVSQGCSRGLCECPPPPHPPGPPELLPKQHQDTVQGGEKSSFRQRGRPEEGGSRAAVLRAGLGAGEGELEQSWRR